MAVGLYAGSFDPIHRGHVELVEAAASCLDRLFVVSAGNPDKLGSLLSLDQRRQLIAVATAHLPNVEAKSHAGLVVDLAAQLEVDVLVRSMGKEQRIELQMAVTNTSLSGLHTIFFSPTAETAHISSRMIRDRIRRDGIAGVEGLVPEGVAALLGEFVRGRDQEARGSRRGGASTGGRDGFSSSAEVNTA
jgi:pantetheine-phosphate adenylyltransferase